MDSKPFVRISLVLVLLSCAAWGQGFGTMNGQVTDATGAAVPDAKVTLTESSTGRTRTAASGQDSSERLPRYFSRSRSAHTFIFGP